MHTSANDCDCEQMVTAVSQKSGGAEAGDVAEPVWVCSPSQDAARPTNSQQVSDLITYTYIVLHLGDLHSVYCVDLVGIDGISSLCCDYRAGRLPGVPSSHLGLQSLTGELDDFGFESYIGFPEENETPGPDMHSLMEAKHKMALPPVTRSIL